MVTTRDHTLDLRIRRLRQHGVDQDSAKRHSARTIVFESHEEVATNARMTDIQAAIGRVQLARLEEAIEERRNLAARYEAGLRDIVGLVLPTDPDYARSNIQSYCVLLPEGRDQRAVMQQLLDRGISTRRAVGNAHREPAYRSGGWRCVSGPGSCGCAGGACRQLAHGEAIQDRGIVLPLFAGMSHSDQDRVMAALHDVLEA